MLVPMLTLLFHVDLRYAIGASLVSVIATSSGAAAAYVREGYSNIRIGMFLETATTIGALAGAAIAIHVSGNAIGVVFGLVLLYSAYLSSKSRAKHSVPQASSHLANLLRLNSTYPKAGGMVAYRVTGVPAGYVLMFGAGVLSGLLGIGSGAVKVLAMDQAMKIPFKVSTTTSNFMIGVTAAASAGVYLSRGYISPGVAMPVMLGVLAGSLLGARVLVKARCSGAPASVCCGDRGPRRRDDLQRIEGSPVSTERLNDQRIEVIIGNLLRAGVILSALVVMLGATIYLKRHGYETVDLRTFHGEPERLKKPNDIAAGAFQLSGRAIIQLGLLLLIATPVARVAFFCGAFAIEGDRLYVVITLIVLACAAVQPDLVQFVNGRAICRLAKPIPTRYRRNP